MLRVKHLCGVLTSSRRLDHALRYPTCSIPNAFFTTLPSFYLRPTLEPLANFRMEQTAADLP